MLWKWGNTHTQVFVLDLDGTLMPSAPIDNACYWEAVFACFGKQGALPDLHGFKHVTDTGILNEWCTRELGRPPRAQEITQIKQHFLQLLQAAWQHQPHHFSPLPGVVNWLQAVEKAQHVHAGIATGGWGHSARLKLKLSGLDRFKLPLASSDDAEARTAIMQVAAQKITGQPPADDAVYTYVGDGVWDFDASHDLGWEFIGIAHGENAARLKQAGATHVSADFSQPDI